MIIYKNPNRHQLEEIVNRFSGDNLFIHYTGHVYGIGAIAYNENAVNRINSVKQRENDKGFILLVDNPDKLEVNKFTTNLRIDRLIEQYWPGNLTLILDCKAENLSHIAINGKIAVRIPDDPLLLNFLKKINKPIVSTSVNRSGSEFLKNIKEIDSEYGEVIEYAIIPDEQDLNRAEVSTIVIFENKEVRLIREGSISFEEIKQSYFMPQILMVCTANICRSPIAHYYLEKRLMETGMHYRVSSAGFMGDGNKISENSEKVLLEQGIDASKHQSQQITEELIRKSWMILTMEKRHKEKIISAFPTAISKVFTLSEYCGSEGDIEDPYMMDIEKYRYSFFEIKIRIDKLIDELLTLEKELKFK